MPASKKSKSLAEQVADAGLVHKSGVCPLLLAAASVEWVHNRDRTAITPSISAWLHQQILGITVTPRQVLDFLLAAAGAGDVDHVVPISYEEYTGRAKGNNPTAFFDVSESRMWVLDCPDVNTTVYTVRPLDKIRGPIQSGYEFYDRKQVPGRMKDAESEYEKGNVSVVAEDYDHNDNLIESHWQAPGEGERNFAADVLKVFSEMLADTAMVTRWAEANKLVG